MITIAQSGILGGGFIHGLFFGRTHGIVDIDLRVPCKFWFILYILERDKENEKERERTLDVGNFVVCLCMYVRVCVLVYVCSCA